jgi:hypothetical protein
MHTRLRTLAILAGVIGFMAIGPAAARAQGPALEVAGGYSYLSELASGATPATGYPRGWVVAAGRPVGWRWLVAVGEMGVNARTNLAIETQQVFSVLGGAHFVVWRRGRLDLRASALAGMERFSEPGYSESGFAFQPGAGLDVRLWRALGARVSTDYRIARLDGATFKNVRVNLGAVIGLGGS